VGRVLGTVARLPLSHAPSLSMTRQRWEPDQDAIALLTWAGIPWSRGPIPTALGLLEPYLRSVGAWMSPRFPEMALRGSLEVPAVWSRQLGDRERSLAWCHLIDKHAAYLGACSSLELGIDHPRRFDRPRFDARLPGYWRIDVDTSPWELALPDPLGRDISPSARANRERWLTTPTLELCTELGVELDVREAWLWPIHRRLLRPFYACVGRARRRLEAVLASQPSDRRRMAATAALRTLKAVYAALLGGALAATRDRKREPRPPWYRPDFRHQVIAKARANLLRNVLGWAAHGVCVSAVFNDGVYVLSDQTAAPAAIRLDAGSLGGYSVKQSWPAARMIGRRGRVVPSLAWGEDDAA